jgi:hypothetical protein
MFAYYVFSISAIYSTTFTTINIKSVPLTQLSGSTTDISALLRFYFWETVYYKFSEASFPSDSKEALGHIVGISEHCGLALTCKILTSDTEHIIYRSLLRPATPVDANLRAGMFRGSKTPIILTTSLNHDMIVTLWMSPNLPTASPPPLINPEVLIGRSFLMDIQEYGQ